MNTTNSHPPKFRMHNLSMRILFYSLFFSVQLNPFRINAQIFPPGFSQVKVGTIYYPTSMAFAPDGRIFATEKAGKVKIIKNGVVLSTPFLHVTVDQLNERGLSSVAIDPNFNTNHFVYIYYTSTSGTIHNRLSRFTANGDVALAGSEVVLLEIEPAVNSIHNAGGMVFGPDGKLYIGIGDDEPDSPVNYTTPNAQNLGNYKGKILRINPDGSVPSGNPFKGSSSADRIWAYGFRNPWTLAIQPGTGKIFANDVGQDGFEEINNVTTGGKNYGWPFAEGPSTNTAYTNPVYAYPHGANDVIGCAISGGTFFNPSSSNYPAEYTGKYFFVDYCNQQINYIDPNNPAQKINFASSIGGSNNYIKVGNNGNLYFYSISKNSLYQIINNTVETVQDNTESPGFLKIFPNPNTGLFTITLDLSKQSEEKVKLRIVDIIGQEVYNKEVIISNQKLKEMVELDASIPAGIYTLQVIAGNKVESRNLVLSKE